MIEGYDILSNRVVDNDMNIQKITLSPDVVTPQKKRFALSKRAIVPVVAGLILVSLVGGMYALFTSFIQWEDEEVDVARKETLSVSITPSPTSVSSEKIPEPTAINVNVKGRVTVTFLKDKGQPFDNGVVQLISSTSGAVFGSRKTGPDGTSGVVVFDEVPAGTYRVVGARENELGVRQASTSISLDPGEIMSTSIRLLIDTPVAITVTVKGQDGTPMADQSLKMVRSKGEEGIEVLTVQTNSSGVFTRSGVFPHDAWKLLKEDTEIATIAVAPTGESQSINVQANSN